MKPKDYKSTDWKLVLHPADCDTGVVFCRQVFNDWISPNFVNPGVELGWVPCTGSIRAYECGYAMLRVSGVAPAPSGHEWQFQCSVGVDCSDAEPRCIWLAVLRGVSPRTSPRLTPIASPRRRGSWRLIQRHRLSWVRKKYDILGWQNLQFSCFGSILFQYFALCDLSNSNRKKGF